MGGRWAEGVREGKRSNGGVEYSNNEQLHDLYSSLDISGVKKINKSEVGEGH